MCKSTSLMYGESANAHIQQRRLQPTTMCIDKPGAHRAESADRCGGWLSGLVSAKSTHMRAHVFSAARSPPHRTAPKRSRDLTDILGQTFEYSRAIGRRNVCPKCVSPKVPHETWSNFAPNTYGYALIPIMCYICGLL